MRFTSQIRYAVYAVFDMAYHDNGSPHQVKHISRREAIPPRYLEQIFQRLLRGGILRSKRGPRGGYNLARAPKEITLGDIVRATEGDLESLFNGRDKGKPRRGRGTHAPAGAAPAGPRGGEQVWGMVTGRMAELLDGFPSDLVREGERGACRAGVGRMYFI
jgi:Rrf2 family protein